MYQFNFPRFNSEKQLASCLPCCASNLPIHWVNILNFTRVCYWDRNLVLSFCQVGNFNLWPRSWQSRMLTTGLTCTRSSVEFYSEVITTLIPMSAEWLRTAYVIQISGQIFAEAEQTELESFLLIFWQYCQCPALQDFIWLLQLYGLIVWAVVFGPGYVPVWGSAHQDLE